MRTIEKITRMQSTSNTLRMEGKTISLVPTMGALHSGHLQLIARSVELADVCVVSIFINPLQFAQNEDLNKYPRDIDGDLNKMNSLGVDYVFIPAPDEMYPDGFQTHVEVSSLQEHLCGPFRPGHFRGVCTAVLKLFNIVKPHVAVLGEKDYQQLKIIQQMVRDLSLDVDIVAHETLREENGLAASSRNSYLPPADRERAGGLYTALRKIKMEFENGQRNTELLIALGKKVLSDMSIEDIDYMEICDCETLESKKEAKSGDLVALALKIGGARLIDNLRL
ncbi:MAG: pantoate--beta-alanine ligase [Thermodesulfobacteriota bacterium]